MSRITRPVGLVAAAALFLAAISLGSRARERFDAALTDAQRYYLPPSGWLRAFAAGYTEAAADLLWIKAVIYFGGVQDDWTRARRAGHEGNDFDARYTGRYVTTVADLDPRFLRAYLAGSRLVLYSQRAVSRSSVDAAIEILERGAQRFPDNGEVWFGLGFLRYYERPPLLEDPDERRESREQGAQLMRRAALMDDAPPYTSLLSTTLLRRAGLDEVVVEHIKTLLYKETDPRIAASLEHQLRRLAAGMAARDIEAAKLLRQRWEREMPYVPFDLFLLLGGDDHPTAAELLDPLVYADGVLGIPEEPAEPGATAAAGEPPSP